MLFTVRSNPGRDSRVLKPPSCTTHNLHHVTSHCAQDGSEIPYGLCIWSTGVGPTPFSLTLPLAKTALGRLAVDKWVD